MTSQAKEPNKQLKHKIARHLGEFHRCWDQPAQIGPFFTPFLASLRKLKIGVLDFAESMDDDGLIHLIIGPPPGIRHYVVPIIAGKTKDDWLDEIPHMEYNQKKAATRGAKRQSRVIQKAAKLAEVPSA